MAGIDSVSRGRGAPGPGPEGAASRLAAPAAAREPASGADRPPPSLPADRKTKRTRPGVTQEGRWTVVAPAGPLDTDTADPVRQLLRRLTDGEDDHILVDLRLVTWMDAAGAGVLIGAYRRARAYRGEFALAGPSCAIRNLLDLTGLTAFVPVYVALDDAIPERGR